jgi:hypothetical protein
MNHRAMNRKEQLEAAQAAKQQLCEQIGDEPWCSGIGLAPAADGGFALRVNVDSRQSDSADLPDTFQGVPIVRVDMLPYKKREEPKTPLAKSPRSKAEETTRAKPIATPRKKKS